MMFSLPLSLLLLAFALSFFLLLVCISFQSALFGGYAKIQMIFFHDEFLLFVFIMLLLFLLPFSTYNIHNNSNDIGCSSFLPFFTIFTTTKRIISTLNHGITHIGSFLLYLSILCVLFATKFRLCGWDRKQLSYFLCVCMCIIVIQVEFGFCFVSFSASCCHCLILPLNGFCARATLSNLK